MSAHVKLETLPLGARFTFLGVPEAGVHVLVHKGAGRATVRKEGAVPKRRTFKATRLVRGAEGVERVTKEVTVETPTTDEPCALGADVVPL